MRNTLQPIAVANTRDPRRSSSRRPSYDPPKLGRHPAHWNGDAWVPWCRPQHTADRRSRLATTLTLTGLALIAITLLTPGFGFALVQWIAIFLAAVGISIYLHRQFVRAGS
jgi:hypothetical protein